MSAVLFALNALTGFHAENHLRWGSIDNVTCKRYSEVQYVLPSVASFPLRVLHTDLHHLVLKNIMTIVRKDA